jgi:hypothetical protein
LTHWVCTVEDIEKGEEEDSDVVDDPEPAVLPTPSQVHSFDKPDAVCLID